jgi:hypothetical protein
MPDDEFTLRMSFLTGFFIVLSLFISWYFRRDPMVRSLPCRLIHAIIDNGYVYQLDAIPTVGFPDPILSYFSALQYSFDGIRMLREGYKKVIYLSFSYVNPSPGQTDDFRTRSQDRVYSKLPVFGDGWCWLSDPSYLMISGGPQMMSCLYSNQPSKYVSMHWQIGQPILIRITQFIQPEYTLDLLNMSDEYHTDIIRSKLTRNIAATFNEVREELIMAMDDLIPTHGDGTWQSPK